MVEMSKDAMGTIYYHLSFPCPNGEFRQESHTKLGRGPVEAVSSSAVVNKNQRSATRLCL